MRLSCPRLREFVRSEAVSVEADVGDRRMPFVSLLAGQLGLEVERPMLLRV